MTSAASSTAFQSTHPRRVWRIVRVLLVLFVCFNPHTHAGCDLTSAGAWSYQSMFQSTHPRRVWHSSSAPDTGVQCFNPHTHAGCDCVISRHCQTMSVSIHTPTQGVTLDQSKEYQELKFQSTHPRRVWLSVIGKKRCGECFNPHTHAGCDYWISLRSIRSLVSIHPPTQGVTYRKNSYLCPV